MSGGSFGTGKALVRLSELSDCPNGAGLTLISIFNIPVIALCVWKCLNLNATGSLSGNMKFYSDFEHDGGSQDGVAYNGIKKATTYHENSFQISSKIVSHLTCTFICRWSFISFCCITFWTIVASSIQAIRIVKSWQQIVTVYKSCQTLRYKPRQWPLSSWCAYFIEHLQNIYFVWLAHTSHTPFLTYPCNIQHIF